MPSGTIITPIGPPVAMERTLAMVKPDAASLPGAIREIKARIASAGLTIEREEATTLSREQAERNYAEYRHKKFFPVLVDFITSGPVLVMELRGPGARSVWRGLMGPSVPEKARQERPDCLRALFGTEPPRNAVHGSDDDAAAAERELAIMFGG